MFPQSKIGAARHKEVEIPLYQGSVVGLEIVSQSFQLYRAGFSGVLVSADVDEEEQNGDGQVSLLGEVFQEAFKRSELGAGRGGHASNSLLTSSSLCMSAFQ